MRRNIEIKARLASLIVARAVAERLATEPPQVQHQVDTYFKVADGRLKLREIEGAEPQLIWYRRSDQPNAKGSDYLLVPIVDSASLKEALSGAVGIDVVVDKVREIYLHDNVRIHLDRVEGLGEFLEFEAVLSNAIDDVKGHEQLSWLLQQFSIAEKDLVATSYSNLLRVKG